MGVGEEGKDDKGKGMSRKRREKSASWKFFGERLTWAQIVGMVLMLRE